MQAGNQKEGEFFVGIMMVTSLNSYVKNMEMTVKWKERQEKKNDTADSMGSAGSTGSTDSSKDSASKTFRKKLDEIRYPQYGRSSQMEADIEIKLTAGKKLSGEEMLYLKNHDKAMYQKAKIIKRERDAYEKALASCKTKDEVEQLKADYASAAVRRINAIRKDSGISREKKRELFQMEHFKAAALDDAMHEFEKRRDYKQLPEGTEKPKPQDEENFQTVERKKQEEGTVLEKAAEAAEYEVPKAETGDEKEKEEAEKSTDDACEEGTIMRAILDEEARWAREEEEHDSASQDMNQIQNEESPEGAFIRRARTAYLSAQTFMTHEETANIDLRR